MLNELAEVMYEIAKQHGFHDKPNDMATYVSNFHGEASELWEAYREQRLWDNCGKKTSVPLNCLEEELADLLIRVLDVAGAYHVDLDKAVTVKSEYNKNRPRMHGKIA